MAQQTINVGTAPNDGTGTPLRTAFQYTNSNFSELYTAVGPSGNNIVVPGNATITGDLTVDTSTLKVDSANNRVGIGTATPGAGYSLDILGAAVGGIRVSSNNYPNLVIDSANSNGALIYIQEGGTTQARIGHLTAVTGLEFSGNNGTAATNVHYAIDSTGISTWKNVGGVAGTAMTLNSTGLGVGGSPTSKLSIFAGADGDVGFFRGGSTRQVQIGTSATAGYLNTDNGSAGLEIRTQGTARAYFDNSGNVGIGVTPSAWSVYQNTIQKTYGAFWTTFTDQSRFGLNCYYNGTNWIYTNSNYASIYEQSSGQHRFYTAPSGTAGNAFSLSQAMTLDASGNLLVGTTSLGARSTNIFSKSGGFGLEVQQRASGSAGSCLGLTYSVGTPNNTTDYFLYCADATTVRAYVVSNGNMLNVNGSYGTISDLRLKENISDARNYLADLLKLRVVKYSLRSEASPTANLIGLIAQEVEQVFPTLVETNADDVKSIKTTVLIPMLLKALQELTARVQTLETR